MLTRRVIACLDVSAGRVVKGVQFLDLRDAGDPAELACAHAENGADEVVLLDIAATHQNRKTLLDVVRRAARQLFIPFTVGGGVRSLDDAAAIFDCGADKITVNSAAVADPALITRIAQRFGSQAVVVAVDARRTAGANEVAAQIAAQIAAQLAAEVFVCGGRTATGRDAIAWVLQAAECGAGEILLTSMDRDGTRAGFDCELTAQVASAVPIPVIASGGAGSVQHFAEVFTSGHADAALAASIFHFGVHSARELKQQLAQLAIPVRWPC